jgi:DNA-directed RNA polymerase subunit RPC12/RpoP
MVAYLSVKPLSADFSNHESSKWKNIFDISRLLFFMVKLVPAVCPNCGAKLQIPDDLKKAYCTYCGTQILIDKEVKVEAAVICPDCNGTGRCIPHKDVYGVTVYTCHGTGRCPACAGMGKIGNSVCSLCNGSGKCWNCGGTGKCPRCGGTGRIVA